MKEREMYKYIAGKMDGMLFLAAAFVGLDELGRDMLTDAGENALILAVGGSYITIRPLIVFLNATARR